MRRRLEDHRITRVPGDKVTLNDRQIYIPRTTAFHQRSDLDALAARENQCRTREASASAPFQTDNSNHLTGHSGLRVWACAKAWSPPSFIISPKSLYTGQLSWNGLLTFCGTNLIAGAAFLSTSIRVSLSSCPLKGQEGRHVSS
jgi:hypothetical protein